MAFTLETLEDFDQTIFNRGAGWAIVFEIHNAILTRAQVTGHQLKDTIGAPFSGLLWLEEGYDPARPELRSKLGQLHSWVGQLISDQSNIRWTEASGRSAEWTIESITSDIGMGDFDDLLVKPQRPEPLVWLVAALNRLRYPKLLRPLHMQNLIVTDEYPEFVYFTIYQEPDPDEISASRVGGWPTPAQAWSDLGDRNGEDFQRYLLAFPNRTALDDALFWQIQLVGSSYGAAVQNTFRKVGLVLKAKDGEEIEGLSAPLRPSPLTIKCLDYTYWIRSSKYNGPDLVVTIGSAINVNIGKSQSFTPKYIESTGPDLDFLGEETVDIELVTATPGSSPFISDGVISVRIKEAWIYCDLPDVLGIGELDAPLPTVAGEATAEEE